MQISPGESLGPYEILSLIGEGGIGQIWKARDTRLDRVVAIKRLKGEYGRLHVAGASSWKTRR